MKHGPTLICAVLLYVTLDLSLPAMPGAFVFEPGDSVESVQTKIGRADAEMVSALPPVTGPLAHQLRRTGIIERPVSRRDITSVSPHPAIRLPRRTLESTAPTEDPH